MCTVVILEIILFNSRIRGRRGCGMRLLQHSLQIEFKLEAINKGGFVRAID